MMVALNAAKLLTLFLKYTMNTTVSKLLSRCFQELVEEGAMVCSAALHAKMA